MSLISASSDRDKSSSLEILLSSLSAARGTQMYSGGVDNAASELAEELAEEGSGGDAAFAAAAE